MKRVFDLVGAVVGLLVASPALAVLAVLVKADSRGPAFYRARRLGRGGREFGMLKLRTMVHDADGAGPPLAVSGDPRITRVGRFLRRWHLDEIPQLWNVLMGDMSIVGPRPEAPEFVDAEDPAWRSVLAARPGITGPTQIEFAGREQDLLAPVTAEDDYRRKLVPRKLESDLLYVAGRSFTGDLQILARSLGAVLRRSDR